MPDLAEKGICCRKNPEAATVGALQKKAYSFIEKGSSTANFLRTTIKKNNCERLPLKINAKFSGWRFPIFNFLVS